MKIDLYEAGGRLETGFTSPGMIMTGPLLLSGSVSSPLEAVHKQYVDTAIVNLNANGFTSGTIPASRMPAFTGDITTNIGTTSIVLNATGVVSGDYTKVTVNNKGLVTGGNSLTEADLPSFSWSKIVNGKPTTLAGYGITDAVSSDNGIITGFLTLNSDPIANNQAATKQYADNQLAGSINIVIGDIISTSVSTTPVGFLRCNGGELTKTTYSTLYSVIGDVFSSGNSLPGAGKPWKQQYSFNITQSNDITGWIAGTPLPGTFSHSQAIVTKNRVYLLGGWNGTAYTTTVYTAPINSDGTIGAWTTSTSLPGVLTHSEAIVTKNRVYLLGGYNGTAYVSTVYTAPINADGTLGTWLAATSLPGVLAGSQAIITKNRVYLLGGINGINSYTGNVYTAPINEDGTIGTWTTASALPATLHVSQAIVTKNRVYMLAGSINATTRTSTVYTAPINADGTLGSWVVSGSLPNILGNSQAIVTKNRVYLFGGYNADYVPVVYTAPVNVDGTLGSWSLGTSLPAVIGWSQVIATKSRVYLLGGVGSGNVANANVYTAIISGGLNDYSAYYTGVITPTESVNFKLPDYSIYENSSLYYYIKT